MMMNSVIWILFLWFIWLVWHTQQFYGILCNIESVLLYFVATSYCFAQTHRILTPLSGWHCIRTSFWWKKLIQLRNMWLKIYGSDWRFPLRAWMHDHLFISTKNAHQRSTVTWSCYLNWYYAGSQHFSLAQNMNENATTITITQCSIGIKLMNHWTWCSVISLFVFCKYFHKKR